MNSKNLAELALEQGKGILHLAPNWVPRAFCVPGRRIKLHPDDYYALGSDRGGIDERWFASTTPADNGPKTSTNEGLSFIVLQDGTKTEQILLRNAINEMKGMLLGERLWKNYGCWPMYAKFFDNKGALPHHVHHQAEHAKLVSQNPKHEAYYFPTQLNNHGGDFPYTFFGVEPGTTKEQIRKCLMNFTEGDNKITNFSRAYRLEPGTGWDVPPGVLHAPGSLCTYEPQEASDVFAMYQSLVGDQIISEEMLWKNSPPDNGTHRIGYRLLFGKISKTEMSRQAASYNRPLLVCLTDNHGGKLPPESSFLDFRSDNCVPSSLQKSLDGKNLTLRFYDVSGKKIK